MRNIFILTIFVGTIFSLSAQQEGQFTQFMHNQLMVNPGFAGSRGNPTYNLIHRRQWIGFEGAPITSVVNYHMPLSVKRVGLGVTGYNQSVGITDQFRLQMAYSYDILNKDGQALRIGFHGNYSGTRINTKKSGTFIQDDGDPLLANMNPNFSSGFNFGTGLHYQSRNIFAGISMPQLIKNQLLKNLGGVQVGRVARHLYGYAGARIDLNENIHLNPNLMTKFTEGSPLSMDFNMNVSFMDKFVPGISYRGFGSGFGESIDLLFLIQFQRYLGLGFSYDFGLSKLATQSSGSMEIMLRGDFGRNNQEDVKFTNPRFNF
jgi:type IX secretion system PorP/SprF family membrane protein